MLRPLTIGSSLFLVCALHAQEQFGIANSNYAGTDAVPLNPARMVTQWPWMDINLFGADVFAWNDHVYVTGKSRTLLGEMRESMRTSASDLFMFNESLADGGRHAFVNAHAAGPAVALGLGRGGIGARVGTRAALSITGIGDEMARFAFNGLGYRPQHGIRYQDNNLRIVGAAWTEFDLSYSHLLAAHNFSMFSAGITAKYLIAHAGGGIGFDALDYTVIDTARAVVNKASGLYGLATPGLNAGSGFGMDLGVVYERTLEEADGYVPHQSKGGCDMMPYRYRIGVSLLDLGGMRFAEAMAGTFDASTAAFPDYTAITANGEKGIDSLLSRSLSGFQRTDVLRIGLPTALSVQYDQRVLDHVYVATDLVQNLAPFSSLRLRRPNTLAVVPRFEMQRVEAALPIVIHEYDFRKPSVGLMLRLNNMVLGSDNLFSLITRSPLYGADVYFRVKWTIFRSPVCRGKKKAKHRTGDGNALPCSSLQ